MVTDDSLNGRLAPGDVHDLLNSCDTKAQMLRRTNAEARAWTTYGNDGCKVTCASELGKLLSQACGDFCRLRCAACLARFPQVDMLHHLRSW